MDEILFDKLPLSFEVDSPIGGALALITFGSAVLVSEGSETITAIAV